MKFIPAAPSPLSSGLFLSRSFLTAGTFLVLGVSSVDAATATWNSASGNTWNVGANWIGATGGTGTLPTSTDDVILDNRNVSIPTTISLQAASVANSLTIGSATGTALGAFTLQAHTGTTAETLALTSGAITIASQVTGPVTIGNTSNGVLTITTSASGFTVTNSNTTQTLGLGAVISGATKTLSLNSAGGTIILSGTNTATGAATIGNITSGTLVQLGSIGALSSFSGTTISAGSAVDLSGKALNSTAFALNGTGISGSGALYNSTGTASDAGAITLGSATTIKNNGALLTLSGALGNGGFLLTVDGTGATTLSGVVSGSGGVKQVGAGTLTLSNIASSYTGVTTVDNAVLSISGTGFSSLTYNGGANSAIGASSSAASNLIIGGGTLLKDYNGALIQTDHLFTIGDASGNTATLDSSAATAGNRFVFTNTGAIAFGSNANHTLTLTGSNTGGNSLAPVLGDDTANSKTTSLVKSGAGTWALTGANTYTGGTVIKAGTLSIGVSNVGTTSGALGASASTVMLGDSSGISSASLYTIGAFTFSNPISVASGSSGTLSLGSTFSGTSIYSGPITLNNNLTLAAPNGGTVNFTGGFTSGLAGTQILTFNNGTATGVINVSSVIGTGTGAISVIKTGAATTAVTFTGANTYTGTTSIQQGLLRAGALNTLSAASVVTLGLTGAGNTATLDLGSGTNSYNQTVAGLGAVGTTLSNNVITNSDTTASFAHTATLTVNPDGAAVATDSTYGGIIQNGSSSKIALVKAGSHGLTLSGANTYTGGTTISGGTLLAKNSTGSATGSGAIAVGAAGQLGGSGIINPTGTNKITFTSGGVLAPGTTGNTDVLTLSATGNSSTGLLNLTGATLAFNLGAGNTSSSLSLTSSFLNEVSGLSGNVFNFTDLTSGSLALGKYTLISSDSSAANPFGGLTPGVLSGFTLNGLSGQIAQLELNQLTGSNDYTLQLDIIAVVPEPGTWAMMAGGFVLLLVLQRRRQGQRP